MASFMRQQRIQSRLTQENLAQKSGVSLATLRKFERSGLISLESFLKLTTALGLLDKVVKSVAPETSYASLDEILKKDKKQPGQRVRQKKKDS